MSTESEQWQQQAHTFALRAADRLREAATKLEDAYTGEPLPADTARAHEALRNGTFDAFTCLGHAAHHHALAILHKERERA